MPSVHVRVSDGSEAQVAGAVTEGFLNAVTETPLAIVLPHGRVQSARTATSSHGPLEAETLLLMHDTFI